MATTPEGKVKAEVKKVLAQFGEHIDGFWPVPSGLGESHLDYVGCVDTPQGGRFFAIETKAPGKKPTPRQALRIENVKKAGGVVFVIDGTPKTDTVGQLFSWLKVVTSGGNS
ncbi:VRR-NUC endonuclease domain-containing protein [Rhizobium phage RHph_TM3_14A]|nr:VRR-NUC endonuclease domain-containing protein [Rhizobium phage RHph_TM27A]QIG66988.1 VRR-NUC endonuclease domain-containing protein [Rhizobium phage RHph_TM27B]QIG67077.1 VRR-NUC endonuclease domain-containing protein [Rhizobium phage RHph_TM29]QIG67533.1 VRR-NUC endonuclease domain-containing protein [Rhizobium phage RHph_TM3_14A]